MHCDIDNPNKVSYFWPELTDGPGSKAPNFTGKVQTHISVYLTISEPHSMGQGDHYWRASIRPLKSTVAIQLLLSCDRFVPVTL